MKRPDMNMKTCKEDTAKNNSFLSRKPSSIQ